MHISPNDEFAKAREGARKYQYSRTNNESTKKKYDEKFLSKLYDNWSRECAEKCIEFKRKDDLQGFQIWIENTKFLAKELERLWEEYQAMRTKRIDALIVFAERLQLPPRRTYIQKNNDPQEKRPLGTRFLLALTRHPEKAPGVDYEVHRQAVSRLLGRVRAPGLKRSIYFFSTAVTIMNNW